MRIPLTARITATVCALLGASLATAATARIDYLGASAPIAFALGDVESALRARGYAIEKFDVRNAGGPPKDADLVVHLTLTEKTADPMFADPPIRAEGFWLRPVRTSRSLDLAVLAHDEAGSMYGGLELAEQIRTKGVAGVVDTRRDPYLPLRGTKFNLPLDLRTPSYSDMSDSAQRNIGTIWDFEFWRAYLDQLARDRYNMVSVWNLHPFPSMVKVPGYENVALDDVWRTTAKLEEDYSTRTTDIVNPAMLAQHEVVKRLTIDQKIDFWRRVMSYAKDRNIAFYVFTWNIYTYGVDGKYGITDDIENPKTRDYFRASVREMFRTYPLLAGMGLTAGENMGEVKMYSGGVDAFDVKENWLFATYGQGVLDAAHAEPQRQFRLIHRQHESRAQDIAATFAPLRAQPNVDFDFSFKYAQAHALSSTTQTFHRDYLKQLGDVKTFWTIRNDDALLLRWAAPDFVRDFIRNIPREPTQGFYFGSDMWVWGRTFLGQSPPRLEIDKQWLQFLLWGRLGYDPTLDDERIAALVTQRFPGIGGAKLLAAWQDASMIYPLVTGFHWADFDFQWYIEACRSRPAPAKTASGFHSVDTFITQPVHPGTDNVPIPRYVGAVSKGQSIPGTSPADVANAIDARADSALKALPSLVRVGSLGKNVELEETRDDIRSMALLGKYYAAKIRGATELAWFRASGESSHRDLAVKHLEIAAQFAARYADAAGRQYAPRLWTNRVGSVDFAEMAEGARQDIEIARTATASP